MLPTGNSGHQSGAYMYIHRQSATGWRIGVSDGNASGEIVQTFIQVADTDLPADGVLSVTFTIDGTADGLTCAVGPPAAVAPAGCLSLQITGGSINAALNDSYGDVVRAGSGSPEFQNGGIPGWDDFPGANVGYELDVSPADYEGPLTTNVVATPNPVTVDGTPALSADVDDTMTGGSTIGAAEFRFSADAGATWSAWMPMAAQDGAFDEASEAVVADLSDAAFDEPGLYSVCVRGIDAALIAGDDECTTLVVYDPSGGFVTGGGWYNATRSTPTFGTLWTQGFEIDTDGWVDNGAGTVHRVLSGHANSGGYADGAASATGSAHARMRTTQTGGCAPPFSQSTTCSGPFTRFGGPRPGTSAANGWTTSVDIYLDVAWAQAHPDWRFDWSVALNKPDNTSFLRDFVFNVGTSPGGAAEFVISASNNAFRNSSFPSNPGRDPQTLTQSGWYTFRHSFSESAGLLVVEMEIIDSNGATVASWTLGGDPASDVGPIRYGWLANQEIHDLPIDNTTISGPTTTTVTGKATFGFVSKYRKGATTPDGNTEFVFKAAGLNFHSTSYDWLVVNQGGSNAQFKGTGTINGAGPYRFMLWAGDQVDDGHDTFRIRIWEESGGGGEIVVYDNGFDQRIDGGNVIVHDGKSK